MGRKKKQRGPMFPGFATLIPTLSKEIELPQANVEIDLGEVEQLKIEELMSGAHEQRNLRRFMEGVYHHGSPVNSETGLPGEKGIARAEYLEANLPIKIIF